MKKLLLTIILTINASNVFAGSVSSRIGISTVGEVTELNAQEIIDEPVINGDTITSLDQNIKIKALDLKISNMANASELKPLFSYVSKNGTRQYFYPSGTHIVTFGSFSYSPASEYDYNSINFSFPAGNGTITEDSCIAAGGYVGGMDDDQCYNVTVEFCLSTGNMATSTDGGLHAMCMIGTNSPMSNSLMGYNLYNGGSVLNFRDVFIGEFYESTKEMLKLCNITRINEIENSTITCIVP